MALKSLSTFVRWAVTPRVIPPPVRSGGSSRTDPLPPSRPDTPPPLHHRVVPLQAAPVHPSERGVILIGAPPQLAQNLTVGVAFDSVVELLRKRAPPEEPVDDERPTPDDEHAAPLDPEPVAPVDAEPAAPVGVENAEAPDDEQAAEPSTPVALPPSPQRPLTTSTLRPPTTWSSPLPKPKLTPAVLCYSPAVSPARLFSSQTTKFRAARSTRLPLKPRKQISGRSQRVLQPGLRASGGRGKRAPAPPIKKRGNPRQRRREREKQAAADGDESDRDDDESESP
ncbi:hypothetical protein FB451DRAFT_137381 [Mycena latifolia]|nr:hypothetical protein FB451DRAFT_137381 [Mycena latifolia]